MGALADVGAAAGILGSIGDFIGALSGPGPTQQLDPEVEATLRSMGLDLDVYKANMASALAGQTIPFQQEMERYPLQLQQRLQDAYTQSYGGLEAKARGFAEDVMGGGGGEYTRNLLSNVGQGLGLSQQQLNDQINQELVASGIDPNSPFAQDMKMRRMNELRSATMTGAMQTVAGMVPQATNILSMGQTSNRLAGVVNPNLPQTGVERLGTGAYKPFEGFSPYRQKVAYGYGPETGTSGTPQGSTGNATYPTAGGTNPIGYYRPQQSSYGGNPELMPAVNWNYAQEAQRVGAQNAFSKFMPYAKKRTEQLGIDTSGWGTSDWTAYVQSGGTTNKLR